MLAREATAARRGRGEARKEGGGRRQEAGS
jgi:hypothetical protein